MSETILIQIVSKMDEASETSYKENIYAIEIGDDISKVETEISIMETEVRAIVANAVDAAGKPAYSNEEKRKAAAASMLNESDQYVSLVARLKVLKLEQAKCMARIHLLNRTYEGRRAHLYALAGVRGGA